MIIFYSREKKRRTEGMNEYKSATSSNNDIFIYTPIFSLGILYDFLIEWMNP